MTKTKLTMLIKFYETNLFIIFPDTIEVSKEVGAWIHLLGVVKDPQISHMANIQDSSEMLPTSYLSNH